MACTALLVHAQTREEPIENSQGCALTGRLSGHVRFALLIRLGFAAYPASLSQAERGLA